LAQKNTIHLNKMKEWQIIVNENAGPGEKYAAEEFQRLFRDITTIELKIETVKSGKKAIYIGKTALDQLHSFDPTFPDLGEEGLYINIGKDRLLIAGGHPRGALYGVYEFFERYSGIRFLTADQTYIPQNASKIPIPFGDFLYVPHFFYRCSYYQENFDNPAFATRLRINTITDDPHLGGKTGQELITHSILTYLPVSEYGEDHPEYYALVDGIRKLNVGGGPQVCSTNPEVIRIVTEGVKRALDAHPSLKSISVSQMDNDAVCECPVCSDLNRKEESRAATHLTLVNAVAGKIAVTHPGVKIGTLAYRYSRKPPKSMKLLPNVQIMLCSFKCCTLHPLDDPGCSSNKLFCQDFYKWKEICENILVWNYNTNFDAYDLPFPNFNVIDKNVKVFKNNNAKGVFMQAAGNGLSSEMSDLRNYVMARCLWNPALESGQLVAEFCHLHYGKSALPILAYLHFVHSNAEKSGMHPGCFPKAVEVGIDKKVAQQIFSYFQEALKLAPDEPTRLRVQKATIPALKAIFATAPIMYKQGLYQFDPDTVGEQTLNQYEHLVRKFSMERVGEEKLTSDYIDELHALKKGLPAVVLENNIWRVLILPQQEGRIAGMFHKPTGSKLINEPRAEEAAITSSRNIKSTWQRNGNNLLITMVSDDGSVRKRRISLPEDQQDIRIHVEYTAGTDKSGLEIRERPCMFRISDSEDPEVVSVFIRDLVWNQGNLNWQFSRGTVVRQLLQPGTQCTSFAFYDHLKHFGVHQHFEAGTFRSFFLYWYPQRKEMGLEMRNSLKTIRKGQKVEFNYGINFLERPVWRQGISG